MQVNVKDLEKSQRELTVELSVAEFAPYLEKGAQKVAEQVKIEGFRPGKVPYEVLKQKIGEMTILEEAAHLAIHKTIDEVINQQTLDRQAVGQPQVNITKLAPGNPLEYKIIVSLLPTIALGEYKNLNIKEEEAIVDEVEVAKALEGLREMRAKEVLVEREVQAGDKIIADVSLFLDKVPLEDGQHKDLAIMLGKDYFVPGFDDKLLGAKKGDERKFALPYPDNHHQKNIAGKLVDFIVKVKDVYSRELPALDDQFAVFFQLKDLNELKDNLRASLQHEKKHSLEAKAENELLSRIIEKAQFGDLPEVIIENETNNILAELEQNITRQGGKFTDYLSHLKKTRDELKLELVPNAIKRVKTALVIRELAIVEKIQPTAAEVDSKLAELKKKHEKDDQVLKMLAESNYRHYLSNVLTNEKVIDQLKDWNYAHTGGQQKG